MENELKLFNSEQFGQIRCMEIDGKPYFVASDVAKALGYINPSKAINDHCKGVTKRYTLTNGGKQQMNIIPEGDLYRLMTHSKLPSAEQFESWVFDEVLPTLRKAGTYETPNKKSPKQPPLSSVNMAAKNLMQVYKEAGVDPKFTALAVSELYKEKAQISLCPPIQSDVPKVYDKGEIAKELGIMSKSGKPHAQAIGVIMKYISICDDEKIKVPFTNNGHSDFDYKYKQSVIGKVKKWVNDHGFPTVIRDEINQKNMTVVYSLEVA